MRPGSAPWWPRLRTAPRGYRGHRPRAPSRPCRSASERRPCSDRARTAAGRPVRSAGSLTATGRYGQRGHSQSQVGTVSGVTHSHRPVRSAGSLTVTGRYGQRGHSQSQSQAGTGEVRQVITAIRHTSGHPYSISYHIYLRYK